MGTQFTTLKEEAAKAEAEQKKEDEQKKKEAAHSSSKPQSNEVKDAYLAAYQAFKEGKSEMAREQFIALLEAYPENEYSDNARFWLAESYYKDGNYEDAILAYEELFKKNPGSDKVPGAMLKQGLAFYALKDRKTGEIVLEKLVEKFPNTEAAKLALKKMNRTSLPPKKK
jgi:tol-pal system protein YbgF